MWEMVVVWIQERSGTFRILYNVGGDIFYERPIKLPHQVFFLPNSDTPLCVPAYTYFSRRFPVQLAVAYTLSSAP